MNRIHSLICCVLLIAVQQLSLASGAATEPKKITTVEGITEYRLSNGLQVLLFPDQSKSTITVNITYLVGSRHEGYGETGMAHLLEHMVFKGTPKHPNIPQELTAHGARPNGTTWYDRTNYFETFAANEENLRWALDLESDRMINSYIAKKDLESEFSVVRNEFESGENDPGSVLMERVMSTAYLWHNYGKSTIGSREDIERVPIENLQAFYKKYYQPDNAVLIVAGKFDEAKTLKMVNEYFGGIPKPTRALSPTYTVEPTQDGERNVVLRRVGDIQMVSCGYHVPSGVHPDFAAVDVFADVVTNEPAGRLYQALVETKKATSAYGFAFGLRDPGFAYFACEVPKDKSLEEATTTLKKVFDEITANPITEEEVKRAKNKSLNYIEQTYNNSERVCLSLSEYVSKGDWRLWFLFRDQLEKVTAADVNRVAAAYFKPSNRTTGQFIPETSPVRAVIPPAPDATELVKEYKGKVALAQAEAFDPAPAAILSRLKSGSTTDGARYSLVKKSTRGNSFNASITLNMGNAQALQNKSTLAWITAEMLQRGTSKYSYQQLNDEFDKAKATINVSGDGQKVTISCQSTKENFASVMALITEMLRNPAFSEAEFSKYRDEQVAGIEQQMSEPSAIAGNVYERLTNPYTKGDFRYAMSFEEEIAAIKSVTAADVKKFYQDFYNGAHATIAIVGDFDEATATTSVNTLFNGWKSTVAYEKAKEVFARNEPKSEKIKTPDKTNAMLMCGTTLELQDNDPDYAALVVGNYILGGGFLNSRLATRIRQKEGLSYGVGSFISASSEFKKGGFTSYAIFNPGNLDKLIAAYQDELKKMLNDGFTETEMKDAVNGLLQSRNVSRSQDRELVGRLGNYLNINRTLEWDIELEKKIAALTVAEVNAAMKKWINPTNITYVQAGDF